MVPPDAASPDAASPSPDVAPAEAKEQKKDEPKVYDLSRTGEVYRMVEEADHATIQRSVYKYIADLKAKTPELKDYQVLFLVEPRDDISSYHANRLYEAAAANDGKQDILLVLLSNGGKIEPAYLVSKTCKTLSKGKFVVAVPRQAKSAATLLALGADEIHMGLMSELGPIDPQIGGFPALGLANALTKINQLVAEAPKASEMWSGYLSKNLSLHHLGHYERLCESAVQYAERLLQSKSLPRSGTAQGVASHFVFHYKDHSFVIDVDEAKQLLGTKVIKTNTAEYRFANDVFKTLDLIRLYLKIEKDKELYYVGTEEAGLVVRAIAKD